MNEHKGKVTLVGAGPFDKGLLTVKGFKALSKADVVLYDRLANSEFLTYVPKDCEKIDVGKISANHKVPQDEINKILLEKALSGKNVVRLKGGDSFVFGRGGEELDLLVENGVQFEVIPGITSAIAAATYAGIPVTHRDFASSLHIVTGHAKAGKDLNIDFNSMVKLNSTMVFLMGLANLPFICDGLLNAGLKEDYPIAIVENGTSSKQRKFVGNLGNITQLAKENNVVSPSIIIAGKVVELSNNYDWFSNKPLNNVKILIASHSDSSQKMMDKLDDLGCDTTLYPCTKITPIYTEMKNFHEYQHIVFTSIQGVKYFFENLIENKIDLRSLCGIEIVAVGVETEKELNKHGFLVDFVPPIYTAESLANCLVKRVKPTDKVLLIRAKKGTESLTRIFDENNVNYNIVAVYETTYLCNEPIDISEYDYVTFTSESTVHAFVACVGAESAKNVTGVCIGEITAKAAQSYGISTVVSDVCTIDSMVAKMKQLKQAGGKDPSPKAQDMDCILKGCGNK